jgi:hypothetical protein
MKPVPKSPAPAAAAVVGVVDSVVAAAAVGTKPVTTS